MQKPQSVFVDTNVLLNENFNFDDYEHIYCSMESIEELDDLKNNSLIGYKAREVIRKIIKYIDLNKFSIMPLLDDRRFTFTYQTSKIDNIILFTALYVDNDWEHICFLTGDQVLYIKALSLGLECELFQSEENKKKEIYTGYNEITLTDEELGEHYQNPQNKWGLLENQYLILKDKTGEVVDLQRWNNNAGFSPISCLPIESDYIEKIKPKNTYQKLAFDLLQNRDITIKVLYGKQGSGKDLLMTAHALNMIQRGIYKKIIFVRNNYEVKNSNPIGFLPGSMQEKLTPWACIQDHVGGMDGLDRLIDEEKVELAHLGFMRGRDIRNSIIYVTEGANMTKEHVKLLIGRIGEGSSLWINGDFEQVDKNVFELNSGLKQIIEKLKDNPLFGCVRLNETERSETAKLADLLDI